MHRLAGKAFGIYRYFINSAAAGKSIISSIKTSVFDNMTLSAGFPGQPANAAQIFLHTDDKLFQETLNASLPVPCPVAVPESESFGVSRGKNVI
jgi:hypothetical protein